MLYYRTTGNPEILLANETLLLDALKKAPNQWPWLDNYNMMVYKDPGGPQDRGAHLDRPFAENNTGFIGSGTRLTRVALQKAKVTLSTLVMSGLATLPGYVSLLVLHSKRLATRKEQYMHSRTEYKMHNRMLPNLEAIHPCRWQPRSTSKTSTRRGGTLPCASKLHTYHTRRQTSMA